jgi:hypothetical protein
MFTCGFFLFCRRNWGMNCLPQNVATVGTSTVSDRLPTTVDIPVVWLSTPLPVWRSPLSRWSLMGRGDPIAFPTARSNTFQLFYAKDHMYHAQYYKRTTCIMRSTTTGPRVSCTVLQQYYVYHAQFYNRTTCIMHSTTTGPRVKYTVLQQDHVYHAPYYKRTTCLIMHSATTGSRVSCTALQHDHVYHAPYYNRTTCIIMQSTTTGPRV